MSETKAIPNDPFAEALAAAQAEMKNAPLNRENPHFRSRYADLAAIRDATIPILAKHGLALLQRTECTSDGFFLITEMRHVSGAVVQSVWPLPQSDKPQTVGSALTYARRYTWAAMCGIAAEEDDDDGNAAQKVATAARQHVESVLTGGKEPNAKPVDEAWGGPLKKTEFKEAVSAFQAELNTCTDYDMLCGLLDSAETKTLLEQMERDRPTWWFGKAGSDVKGYRERIDDLRAKLLIAPELPE